jgi:hypothetical protein
VDSLTGCWQVAAVSLLASEACHCTLRADRMIRSNRRIVFAFQEEDAIDVDLIDYH